MVALYWFEKRLLTYWFIREVLPTLGISLRSCRTVQLAGPRTEHKGMQVAKQCFSHIRTVMAIWSF